MSDLEWNSVTVGEEELPQVSAEDLRNLAAELDPEDYDEPVQEFLRGVETITAAGELKQAATLLLQDEVDFSPELAALGVEPDMGLIDLLIAAGADVNAANAYGMPPLHLAARYGYGPVIDKLLVAGAKVTLKDRTGRVAADWAEDAALAARLSPPAPAAPDGFWGEADTPLPPEMEDADYVPQEGHNCHCGHHHGEGEDGCHCGCHHHAEGEDGCRCGCHHHGEQEGECGGCREDS